MEVELGEADARPFRANDLADIRSIDFTDLFELEADQVAIEGD